MFDASAIIYGWDNYPIDQFPGVWEYIGVLIQSGNMAMCQVAYDEVGQRSPECHRWLRGQDIERFPVDLATINLSLEIKAKLGIVDDNYHGKGVGENDLLIIGSAKVNNRRLVTNEARQGTSRIVEKRKYRIPAACDLPAIQVDHLNFLDLLRESGRPF